MTVGKGIAFETAPAGTSFGVRVQPRASRTEVTGVWQGAVRIRVAAPPVDGAANDALVRFLAKRLGVSRSAIQVVAGQASRNKRVMVEGVSPGEVTARLL